MLDVGDDRGRDGARIETIPGRARWVIEGHGADSVRPDAQRLASVKAMEDEAGRHLLKRERIQRWREQGQQGRLGGCAAEIAAPDMDFAGLVMDRPEEGQPLDGVMMQMHHQQVDRLIVRPERSAPQIDDPRSGIDDIAADRQVGRRLSALIKASGCTCLCRSRIGSAVWFNSRLCNARCQRQGPAALATGPCYGHAVAAAGVGTGPAGVSPHRIRSAWHSRFGAGWIRVAERQARDIRRASERH